MDTYTSAYSRASLGSGQVESDPEKPIIHFGSPARDYPPPPDPEPVPDPTEEPEPQVFGPEPPPEKPRSLFSRWFR